MNWQTLLKQNLPELLAGLLIVAGIAASVWQLYISDSAHFCANQLVSHETLIVSCVIGAIGLIAGKYLTKITGTNITTKVPEILASLLILVGIITMLHQRFFTNDGWFHTVQVFNIESIIGGCIAGMAGLLIGKHYKKG